MKSTSQIIFLFCISAGIIFGQNGSSQFQSKVTVYVDSAKNTISKHIYGQFSEHLGRGIYGGIWVGENSRIPNTRGIRNDVIAALKKIKVPNLRWPGGCFADEYHWRDGIGPRDQRPSMVNTNWGGVTEDNSFGTHEFFDLCDQLETEPYISGNVGSGSVEEMAKWVEYISFDGKSPMADLRRKNGREKPWHVKYWGVGNESWGCGGSMTPEYYSDLFKRYATYCRDYGENRLIKIASGANSWDLNWTKVLMEKVSWRQMKGLSLHYYSVDGTWEKMRSATSFTTDEYFSLIEKCLEMDSLLIGHIKIMDKFDPEKRVELMVDEWGTWHKAEPGSTPGFLYQQNTLRDAFVAALTLNIFHKHSDRVKMANIAQTVNVLQAMILTENEKIILTPTYHVFDLYKVHQEARYVPSDLQTETINVKGRAIPLLSVSCSIPGEGNLNISIVNIHPEKSSTVSFDLKGMNATRATGKIIAAKELNAYNSFEQPENVKSSDFNKISVKNNTVVVEMPAKSIVVLNVK